METLVVDIKEAESHLSELIGRVGRGAAVVVNVGEKAVAKILPAGKRIPGLNAGSVWMSDDFDEPLPDGFWLGEE